MKVKLAQIGAGAFLWREKLDPSGVCLTPSPSSSSLMTSAPPSPPGSSSPGSKNLLSCSLQKMLLRWGCPNPPATLQPPAWGYRAGRRRKPKTLQLPFQGQQSWGDLLPGDVDNVDNDPVPLRLPQLSPGAAANCCHLLSQPLAI